MRHMDDEDEKLVSELRLRLDVLTALRGGFSREYAKEIIEKGLVAVNGNVVTKAGAKVGAGCVLQISAEPMRYVSRGGYKLEKAIEIFGISLHNRRCMDIGASTGGFTDCMLQHGAASVCAVDSGTGQLDEGLSRDPRVLPLEKTNIRDYTTAERFDFIAVDVSFISLTLVLEKAAELLREGGQMVCLVKPQFEVGRSFLNKKGIVTSPKARERAVELVGKAAGLRGLKQFGVIKSPITGRDGNVEYLMLVEKSVSH